MTHYHRNKGLKYKFKFITDITKNKQIVQANIAQTPFEVFDSYDSIPTIDYSTYSAEYAIINFRNFLLSCGNLSPRTIIQLMFIYYIIEPDTNIVHLNKNAFTKIYQSHIQERQYFNLINQLLENDIICRANKAGTFIVNHNIIFKGDLNKFASRYKLLYGKWKTPEFNDKHRIVLTKQNAGKVKTNQHNIYEQFNKMKSINISKFSFIKKT